MHVQKITKLAMTTHGPNNLERSHMDPNNSQRIKYSNRYALIPFVMPQIPKMGISTKYKMKLQTFFETLLRNPMIKVNQSIKESVVDSGQV